MHGLRRDACRIDDIARFHNSGVDKDYIADAAETFTEITVE